ncbi:type I methionyl aminopeptidase [Myxococcota bacterium]|nr:type I methionyl aminopeptidase [Myxococcota bacterium]
MREAGRHTGEILLLLREAAKPGVRTGELNEIAAKELKRRGLRSPFLGYSPGGLPPYPAVLCVSINDEIVHGIPGSRELKEGDILSLDFGVDFDGFHGDSAVTIPMGSVPGETHQLVDTTRDSLYEGIAQMVPGQRLSDIGHAVQVKAERAGYSVVRQFVGHGIGREMHEPPQVPNYGRKGRGPRLTAGMVFAIEPMVNVGTEEVRMLEDEWTAVTADGALSAHFEHTVAITDEGPEVLTAVQGSH